MHSCAKGSRHNSNSIGTMELMQTRMRKSGSSRNYKVSNLMNDNSLATQCVIFELHGEDRIPPTIRALIDEFNAENVLEKASPYVPKTIWRRPGPNVVKINLMVHSTKIRIVEALA